MSFYKSFIQKPADGLKKVRTSITLMQSQQSYDGQKYGVESVLAESDFSKNPYTSMSIHDFSVNAIVAAGGHPDTVFIPSSQVDQVVSSIDDLKKVLNS